MTRHFFPSTRVIRAERLASRIVRSFGLCLLYPAAWHFGGWWGIAGLLGYLLLTPVVK